MGKEYLLIKVWETTDGELEVCCQCKPLTWQKYLDSKERMAQRERAEREAAMAVPKFAVRKGWKRNAKID